MAELGHPLDRADELLHMQGGPGDPPPGTHYACIKLLTMALEEIIGYLREREAR